MSKFNIPVLLAMALIAMPRPALCETAIGANSDQTAETSAATRIEVDEDGGRIRFYIDGELAVQLDADGFHVRHDVSYGDTLRDTGTDGFDKYIASDQSNADGGADEK